MTLWVLVMVPVVLLVAVAAMAVPQRLSAESSLRGAASDLGEVAVRADSGAVGFDEVNGVQGLRLDGTECAAGAVAPPTSAAVSPAGPTTTLDPRRLAVSEVVCATLLDMGAGGVSWDSVDGYYSGVVSGAVAVDGGRWLLCEGDGAEAVYVSVVADWAEAGWAAAQVWPDGVRLGAEGLVLGEGSGLSDAGADCSWARDGVDLQHAVARYPLRDELVTAALQTGQPPTTPAATTTTTTVAATTTTVPGSGTPPLPVSADKWHAMFRGYSLVLYEEDPAGPGAHSQFDFDIHFNGPVPNVPDPGWIEVNFWDKSDNDRLGKHDKLTAVRGASCADRNVDFVAPRQKIVRLVPGTTMQTIFKPGEVKICRDDGYERQQRFFADFRVRTTFDTDPKHRSLYQRFKDPKLNFFRVMEFRIIDHPRVTADCNSGRRGGGKIVGEGTTITCKFTDGAGREKQNRYIAVTVQGEYDNGTRVIDTPSNPQVNDEGTPYFNLAQRGKFRDCPADPKPGTSKVDFVVPADGMTRGAAPADWYPDDGILVLAQETVPIGVERWNSDGSEFQGRLVKTHITLGPRDFSPFDTPESVFPWPDAQIRLEEDQREKYPVTDGEYSFFRDIRGRVNDHPGNRIQIKICDNDGEYREDDVITDQHDLQFGKSADFDYDQHVDDRRFEALRIWYTAVAVFQDLCPGPPWQKIKDYSGTGCIAGMAAPDVAWQYKVEEYEGHDRSPRWKVRRTQPGHTCDKPYVDGAGLEWKCIEFKIMDGKPKKPKP